MFSKSKSKSKSSLLLDPDPDSDFDFDGSNPHLLRSYPKIRKPLSGVAERYE